MLAIIQRLQQLSARLILALQANAQAWQRALTRRSYPYTNGTGHLHPPSSMQSRPQGR